MQANTSCFTQQETAPEYESTNHFEQDTSQEDFSTPTFWNQQCPTYRFLTILSETDQSIVWLATCPTTQELVAIKVIGKAEQDSPQEKHQEQMLAFLRSYREDWMVSIKEIIKQEEFIFLVMKYCSKGTLESESQIYTSNSYLIYSQQHLRFVAEALSQIISAVLSLHDLGYIHRDVKLSNLLLSASGKILLNDFDLVIKSGQEDSSLCGTYEYMAPERLSESRKHKQISPPCDVWSIGIIAFELLTGDTPFHGQNCQEILDQICEGYIPVQKQLPSQAKSFIFSILNLNPEKRPSLKNLVKHQFLRMNMTQCVSDNTLEEVV